MRTLIDPATVPQSPLLLVLLTGTYGEPEDFVREGFVDAARGRGIDAEIALVGTRASKVVDGTVVGELRDDLVAPARARGRTRVWLAGISLGATAAMAYASRHEAEVEGLVLLSPYPGTRDVLREIAGAGGLDSWSRGFEPAACVEREAWAWLARRERRPRVHLYYGAQDRFVEGQRLMAAALPPGASRELEGGHDWPAWRRQWARFLDEHAAALRPGAAGVASATPEGVA
jgi:pimeloyl-ACP methyl ester carboxylesterase